MSTLILSGWAQPADALCMLAEDAVTFDYSDYATLDVAIAELKNIEHTQCVAWSLGGLVALHAIAAGALNPRHLTLIAVPYQFVASEDFKPAMDVFTYETFRENYIQNPARTKDRFHALVAKGDAHFKRVLSELHHHSDVENISRWLPWLEWLGASKNPPVTQVPTLIVHGMRDAIVPYQQAQRYAEILPNAAVSLWEETGHAPHLHDGARLKTEIAAHRKAYDL